MATEPIEKIRQKVLVWSAKLGKWIEGIRKDVRSRSETYEFFWTNVDNTTGVAPDRPETVDIDLAERITIQIDTTHASHTSTDTDINVLTSIDGKHWDTEPYAARNLGDNKIQTFLVDTGPKLMRLTCDENDATPPAYIAARVSVEF